MVWRGYLITAILAAGFGAGALEAVHLWWRDHVHYSPPASFYASSGTMQGGRVEAYKERSAKADFDVLFIGDSILDYARDVPGWEILCLPRVARFTLIGESSPSLLAHIKEGELNGAKPKVIVLEIGTNDFALAANNTVVAGHIADAINAIHEHCPDARIILIGILPRTKYAQGVAEVNALTARIPGITFTNPGQALAAADGSIKPEYTSDGVHLKPVAYKILLDQLRPIFAQLPIGS